MTEKQKRLLLNVNFYLLSKHTLTKEIDEVMPDEIFDEQRLLSTTNHSQQDFSSVIKTLQCEITQLKVYYEELLQQEAKEQEEIISTLEVECNQQYHFSEQEKAEMLTEYKILLAESIKNHQEIKELQEKIKTLEEDSYYLSAEFDREIDQHESNRKRELAQLITQHSIAIEEQRTENQQLINKFTRISHHLQVKYEQLLHK